MRAGTRRLIPFAWQAVFILLPVTLLAAVSLISLRRDTQRAEQDARSRAAEDVQTLARAMRTSVHDELQRFLTLQNEWTDGMGHFGLGDREQPGVKPIFPDEKLNSEIGKWEQDYPGMTFPVLAAQQAEILADGSSIDPPEIAAVTTPPAWFRELSPKQHRLWARLKRAIDTDESGQINLPYIYAPLNPNRDWLADLKRANTTNAFGKFLDTDPPFEALFAATVMQTTLKVSVPTTSERALYSGALQTETGLSFEELSCYRVLSAKDAGLTDSLLQRIWWQVTCHPSFISEHLLELAEALTNHADSVTSQKVYWTRQYVNEQANVRARFDQLRRVPDLTNWNVGATRVAWLNGSHLGALAFFEPQTIRHDNPWATSATPLSGRGYLVSFVPNEILQAIFTRALRENKIFIPAYETAAVTVEGDPFQASFPRPLPDTIPAPWPPKKPGPVAPSDLLNSARWQLLGSASQTAGTVAMPDTVAFSVNLYLTDRDQMLSDERRRFRLFALIITGAAFSALIGLIAAWRAFYRQQELNEMKINFVSSVSHELRAPIASVRLMAENLERGKIPEAPRQNEYFRFIVQECRRLSSLIENVLDFSRIEQGRKQYEFEPANLVALVQTTVKLLEPYAAEKGVRLEIADAGAASIDLEVDCRAIQQALVNLIDNAIKHSPKGETVTVGVGTPLFASGAATAVPARTPGGTGTNEQSSPAICLFVADHGPGIPPEEHEKIFERFYRRGSELRRETQGVGIGLSVVQHIVEAHGGRVRVESEPGKGSRFIIELPPNKQNE